MLCPESRGDVVYDAIGSRLFEIHSRRRQLSAIYESIDQSIDQRLFPRDENK